MVISKKLGYCSLFVHKGIYSQGDARKKSRLLFMSLLFLLWIYTPIIPSMEIPIRETTYFQTNDYEKNHRSLRVAALLDGEWHELGALSYDKIIEEKSLDIQGLNLSGDTVILVEHNGTTAAHIDSVRMGASTPVNISGTFEEPDLALRKLAVRDYDVIDVKGRKIIITFFPDSNPKGLFISARIEPENIPPYPFLFPKENIYQTMDETRAFYCYTLYGNPGALTIDGEINGENLGNPFLKAFTEPGTGHPANYIYGWVMNDDDFLYVALDFTSDNTMDGDKDYGAVYIKTIKEVKEFKVSVPDQTWGTPGFIYTERADYQHKVYEFKIPFCEIEGADRKGIKDIEIAFGAYGTATVLPRIINEVDAVTTGDLSSEFIELLFNGMKNTTLINHVVVLYDGETDATYGEPFDLSGYKTDERGYFVIGGAGTPGIDERESKGTGIKVNLDDWLQDGTDAVAIYYNSQDSDFPPGTPLTTKNLLDALVYDSNDPDDSNLLTLLEAGQPQINEDDNGDMVNHSNQRCPNYSGGGRNTYTYTQYYPSPGSVNRCGATSATIIINEVDANTPTVPVNDNMEFVELYDGGIGNTDLSGLVMVFFNGNGDVSYAAFDLDGYSTDENGYFVLGNEDVPNVSLIFNANTLQNGADAVALYLGNASDFPPGTSVMILTANLLDAIVYDTSDPDDVTLMSILLNIGEPQVNEAGMANSPDHSNQRCPDGGVGAFNTSWYLQDHPSPGEPNECELPDLEIHKICPSEALIGSDMVYTITLENKGQFSSAYTLLTDTLPDGVSYVSDNSGLNCPSCTPGATGTLIWEAGDLTSDTLVSFEVVVHIGDAVSSGSILTNTISADSYVRDMYPSDNIDSCATLAKSHYKIHEIQGSGLTSPFVGEKVLTKGNIVTALASNGFYMQTPDNEIDGFPETSEGIYVHIGQTPEVLIGDMVDVKGWISETDGETHFTDIPSSPVVLTTSSGIPLPDPMLFDPSPNQPQPDTEQERYEGMLVTVTEGIVTDPTNMATGNAFIVTGNMRAFREPGIEYPGLPSFPVWDGNPEIYTIDPDAVGSSHYNFSAGTLFSATGPLGYSQGYYQVKPVSISPAPSPPLQVLRHPFFCEFTIATQNMSKLYNDADNGNGEFVETPQKYADRLNKFSLLIRDILHSPDILAAQEVENINVLNDLADKIHIDDPQTSYSAWMLEGNDPDSLNIGFLVKSTIRVDDILQIDPEKTFEYDKVSYHVHDYPPLLLSGSYTGTGGRDFPLQLINVHILDMKDIESSLFVRQKRYEQAESIASAVQNIQTTQPDLPLVVLGDFNAYQFTDGYVDVLGQITGDPDPGGALLPGTDIVEPNLENMIYTLPEGQRYSLIRKGNAEALSHILTSQAMNPFVEEIGFGRGNADTPTYMAFLPMVAFRASNQDGLLMYVRTLLDIPLMKEEPEYSTGTLNRVEWFPVKGAGNYVVECSEADDFETVTYSHSIPGNISSYVFEPLSGDTRYWYHVRGENDCVTGEWSPPVSSIQDAMAPESEVTAPDGITSNPLVMVEWTGSDQGILASGIDHIRIYWNKDDGPYQILGAWSDDTKEAPFDIMSKGGYGVYGFYSVAMDKAGNREDAPGEPDITVMYMKKSKIWMLY